MVMMVSEQEPQEEPLAPWYALATYFDPKPYRRRPSN